MRTRITGGKKMITEKILSIFRSNSPPEDDVTQKWKVREVELNFSTVSENVIVFKIAPWEGRARTNLFSKIQKWTFFNPNLGVLFKGSFLGGG